MSCILFIFLCLFQSRIRSIDRGTWKHLCRFLITIHIEEVLYVFIEFLNFLHNILHFSTFQSEIFHKIKIMRITESNKRINNLLRAQTTPSLAPMIRKLTSV